MKKIALLSILALSACSTIIDERMQPVEVSVEPNAAADCTFKGRDFDANAKVPSEVKLKRSYYPIDATCTTADGRKGTARIIGDVSPLGYTSSIVGLGVGGIVDASTGYAFEYPEKIVIKLGTNTVIGKGNLNNNVDFE